MIGDILARIINAQRDRQAQWYTGRIARLNGDGSYAVLIVELNVVYPRLFRTGAEKIRLHVDERVVVRERGGVLELL